MDEYGMNLLEFLENFNSGAKIRVKDSNECIFEGCVKDISEDEMSEYCVLLSR